MDISVKELKNSSITIVFHVGGKEYAPTMDKERLDTIKALAAVSVAQLVEVKTNIKIVK